MIGIEHDMAARLGNARSRVAASLLVGLCVTAMPAHAQLTGNTVIDNHPTTTSFTQSYTPAPGSDRVVLAIVFSEYNVADTSAITSATLGGVPLNFLATLENTNPDPVITNKNRMSLFYLPEAQLPSGAPDFTVTYGPDPSSSLIYLTTGLGIRQDTLGATPVALDKDCPNSGTIQGGVLPFGPIQAQPSDIVLSFVGTGRRQATTTFNNGGSELFDTSVSGPGFSFAGAVQSPQTATTVAGTATISEGCNRRPITSQILLRPLGSDGTLDQPPQADAGDAVTVTITDADLNISTSLVDTVTVSVTNPRTGETQTVTLTETGPDTGVFTADIPTVESTAGAEPGPAFAVQGGDTLQTTYEDTLTGSGGTATLTDSTLILSPGAPPELVASKSVVTAPSDSHNIPGSDVIYSISVSNTGAGPVADGSIFLLDALPPEIEVFIGDPVAGDGDTDPVRFRETGASGLDYQYARDVRFAGSGPPPAAFADCPVAPPAGYGEFGYICIAPKGELLPGDPDPGFTVTFRARVK